MSPRWTIAVDGPAGAGKSTVARLVAERLHYLYIDTGAMYRALALLALERGADLRDEEQVAAILQPADIVLSPGRAGQPPLVWLDGRDVSEAIRTPEVNASVSVVAGFPAVRREMVERQRRLAAPGGVVLDGRDIGTFVLPDADIKFFLTASLAERAARRAVELQAMGYAVPVTELEQQIAHRDHLDETRAVAPLRQAADAYVIDTTRLSVEAVVAQMLDVIGSRGG